MRPNHFKREHIDVTTVTGREELAGAFGTLTAWRLAVDTYRLREARETDPTKKRRLRLMMFNAETQLRLVQEGND